MKLSHVLLVLSIIAGIVACSPAASNAEPTQPSAAAQAVFLLDNSEVVIALEVANTEPLRARGLMHRDRLPPYTGMVFVFPSSQNQTFWMKNTNIPLDMLFVSTEGLVVGIVENAEPLTLTPRSVHKPSKYVVELAGGSCAKLGIKVGTRVRFTHVPDAK